MKKCTKCLLDKSLDLFYKRKSANGFIQRSHCKPCTAKSALLRKRTFCGYVDTVFRKQKRMSVKRGHKKPEYSSGELFIWIRSQNNFNNLWESWIDSGYKTKLRPSVDRLDDSKGYSFNNIQLVTWGENLQNQYDKQIKKVQRPVLQYTMGGKLVAEYFSITEASKNTDSSISNIVVNCQGKTKTSKGYVFKYT